MYKSLFYYGQAKLAIVVAYEKIAKKNKIRDTLQAGRQCVVVIEFGMGNHFHKYLGRFLVFGVKEMGNGFCHNIQLAVV